MASFLSPRKKAGTFLPANCRSANSPFPCPFTKQRSQSISKVKISPPPPSREVANSKLWRKENSAQPDECHHSAPRVLSEAKVQWYLEHRAACNLLYLGVQFSRTPTPPRYSRVFKCVSDNTNTFAHFPLSSSRNSQRLVFTTRQAFWINLLFPSHLGSSRAAKIQVSPRIPWNPNFWKCPPDLASASWHRGESRARSRGRCCCRGRSQRGERRLGLVFRHGVTANHGR